MFNNALHNLGNTIHRWKTIANKVCIIEIWTNEIFNANTCQPLASHPFPDPAG